MSDLIVASVPLSEGPLDRVQVSLEDMGGTVRITHLAARGRSDEIARPSSEILPLFWRFMIVKFGIHPARDLR